MTPEGRQAMKAYMEQFPRSSRPAHSYAVHEHAKVDAERAAFRKYQEYFNVPSES
jgi:hypothetical protein